MRRRPRPPRAMREWPGGRPQLARPGTPSGTPGRVFQMSFSIEFADDQGGYDARIKVIGCGGSGGNAVNTMMNFGLEGVEFVVVNTDAQALGSSLAPTKVHI